jgi:hypothetical protein
MAVKVWRSTETWSSSLRRCSLERVGSPISYDMFDIVHL